MKTNHASTLAALALVFVAAPARAGGPCDELVAYMRDALEGAAPLQSSEYGNQDWEKSLEERLRSDWHTAPPAYITRVTPECRAAIQRGTAPAAVAAARAWTHQPEAGWIELGRIMLCAMQDPGSLAEVPEWMGEAHRYGEARAVCASALATWPGAEEQRSLVAARAVRPRGDWLGRWEIDPAIVAVANARGTPELRDGLVPVLEVALAKRALGYDRLQDGVCTDDGQLSRARERACTMLPLEAEYDWWYDDQWKRWLASGVATAGFVGLVTASFTESQEVGRSIAAGSGATFGSLVGGMMGWGIAAPGVNKPPRSSESLRRYLGMAAGTVVGGVVGGVLAHSYATSPESIGGTTVVTLTPAYLTALLAIYLD
jgi:hypothetical protein